MPVDELTRQLDWMASGKVLVVPPRELVENPKITNAIALTFDDGFLNFGEIAAPLILERGLCATVFVATERVGGTNKWDAARSSSIPQLPLLGWDELRNLAEKRIEVGGHGQTHRSLKALSQQALDYEIADCSKRVEVEIGKRPDAFAFPYGDFDSLACTTASRCFRVACTTEMRTIGKSDNRSALPRIDMYYFRGKEIGDAWGKPAFAAYVKLRASMRSIRAFAGRANPVGDD